MKYKNYIKDKKIFLDNILILHKTQPVGWGYIDIICYRSQINSLVEEITNIGFIIRTISWWEHIKNRNEKPRIGMGGPVSIFYPGYFAEINDYDDLYKDDEDILNKNYVQKIEMKNQGKVIEAIRNKNTKLFGSDSLSFIKDECLTPALWIEVPEDWVNPFSSKETKQMLPEYQILIDTNRKENLA